MKLRSPAGLAGLVLAVLLAAPAVAVGRPTVTVRVEGATRTLLEAHARSTLPDHGHRRSTSCNVTARGSDGPRHAGRPAERHAGGRDGVVRHGGIVAIAQVRGDVAQDRGRVGAYNSTAPQ